jgi:hypothetical protein
MAGLGIADCHLDETRLAGDGADITFCFPLCQRIPKLRLLARVSQTLTVAA